MKPNYYAEGEFPGPIPKVRHTPDIGYTQEYLDKPLPWEKPQTRTKGLPYPGSAEEALKLGMLEEYTTAVINKEKDPNGIEAKVPGAKLDAGKISVTRGCLHYFPRALSAVAELSTIGAKKYSWKGWEAVPDGIHRYGDALGRHELRIESDYTRRDPDTDVLEATAVAWNALARLELILRGNK